MTTGTDPLFISYPLSDTGIKKVETITDGFNNLLTEIRPVVPAGREWSIVQTKLEEACMYAKKAVSTLAQNQGRVTGVGGGTG